VLGLWARANVDSGRHAAILHVARRAEESLRPRGA
jgi:hypothetical protein